MTIYVVDCTCHSVGFEETFSRLEALAPVEFVSWREWERACLQGEDRAREDVWVVVWDDSPFTNQIITDSRRRKTICGKNTFFVVYDRSDVLHNERPLICRDAGTKLAPVFGFTFPKVSGAKITDHIFTISTDTGAGLRELMDCVSRVVCISGALRDSITENSL